MSSSTGADRRCGTSGGASEHPKARCRCRARRSSLDLTSICSSHICSLLTLPGRRSTEVTCQSNELSLMVVVVQTSKYRFQLNKEIRRKESLQTYDMPGLKTEFSAALDP
ncbi:hypothetical protein U9M48_002787 [Paspalum notatum var. saurae]|uniref:Uncharacterized protein n=1 Tax=Paspalum notatum var. saurae TaxID=547442 RepID=A0AAQ3PRQ1_PASNO